MKSIEQRQSSRESDLKKSPEYLTLEKVGKASGHLANWMRGYFAPFGSYIEDPEMFMIVTGTKDPKAGQMIEEINEKLGDRLDYQRHAYHFSDALWALAANTQTPMELYTRNIIEYKQAIQVSTEMLRKIQGSVGDMDSELQEFLAKDIQKGFTVGINDADWTYTIEDLHLDAAVVNQQWAKYKTVVFPL